MTMNVRILLLAGICLFPLTSASGDSLSEAEVASLALRPVWSAQAVMNSSRDKISYFTSDVNNVYMQSSAGVVSAFNADTGRKLWASQVGLNDEVAKAAASNKDSLLVVAGPVVHSVNKFSGTELFSFRLPGQPATSPVLDSGSLYICMIDGTVAGMSLRSLEHQERFGKLPAGVPRPITWRFVSGDTVSFPPVAGQNSICVVTDRGNVHVIFTRGNRAGKSVFQLMLKHSASVPPALVRRDKTETILLATTNNQLFSFDLEGNGETNWNYPLTSPVVAPIITVGDDVYVVTSRDGLTRFSLSRGKPVSNPETNRDWMVPGVRTVAAVSEKWLYVIDAADRLLKISRENSHEVGSLQLNEYRIHLSNAQTDRILVSTANGRVVCLAEQGSDFATYHQSPESQPVMPEVGGSEPVEESAAESGAEEAPAP